MAYVRDPQSLAEIADRVRPLPVWSGFADHDTGAAAVRRVLARGSCGERGGSWRRSTPWHGNAVQAIDRRGELRRGCFRASGLSHGVARAARAHLYGAFLGLRCRQNHCLGKTAAVLDELLRMA